MPLRKGVGVGMCLIGVAVAVAGCGATQSSTPSSTTASHEVAVKPCRSPAHIITGDRSPYPGAVIGPVHNAWVAGDTTVWAGGQGYKDPNKGKFLIIRNGMAPHADSIYVDRAGALKIIKAPLGCAGSAIAAQRHANLEFTSTNGVTGTLYLSDDTVTLDPESTDQRAAPCRPGGSERFHGRLLPGIPDGLGATADNLWPQTNMWLVHVCHHFTAVGAGADPDHRANGRFTIYRRGERPAKGTVKTVEVAGAGTLRITKTPVGRRVVTPAQEPTDIEFKGKNGATGTLHLSDDTVTLNP